MEHDLAEALQALCERRAPVLLPKELGVSQPGPNDALIPSPDFLWDPALDVGDRDEARKERPIPSAYRKAPLVPLHACYERLLGQGEEPLVEVSGKGDRPLHQGRHLLKEILFPDRLSTGITSRAIYTLLDPLTALIEVDNDISLLVERTLVVLWTPQGDTLASSP